MGGNDPGSRLDKEEIVKRTAICSVLLIIALCLVASGPAAGECKKIQARVDIGPLYSGCTYDSVVYEWCSDSRVRGNFRGTWHLYANPDFNCFVNTVEGDQLGTDIEDWVIWSCWNLAVFETKHGDLITQGNDYVNEDSYFTYGAFSSTLAVIDGTGKYEGATGWLGGIGNEFTGQGILRGEICTP